MMNTHSLIALHNISKTYPKAKVPAVSSLSFTLKRGQTLCLLGPNGAGKTTTIKMVLGLISPTSGSVIALGHDMTVDSQRIAANPHIGVILEGARNIYWRLSPLENLRYFGANRGLPRREVDKRALALLRLLDLEDHAGKMVGQLSRGMKQKVALANALLHDPDILILDEPTLGLDVESARKIEQVITRLMSQGKAILLTTHQMPLAERLATHIFVIKEGKKVAYADTQTLLARFDPQTVVEIKVGGELTAEEINQITVDFPAITPTVEKRQTLLEWVEPEQRSLLQLLDLLDRRGYQVLSFNQREPSLEEVFLSLTNQRENVNGAHRIAAPGRIPAKLLYP